MRRKARYLLRVDGLGAEHAWVRGLKDFEHSASSAQPPNPKTSAQASGIGVSGWSSKVSILQSLVPNYCHVVHVTSAFDVVRRPNVGISGSPLIAGCFWDL